MNLYYAGSCKLIGRLRGVSPVTSIFCAGTTFFTSHEDSVIQAWDARAISDWCSQRIAESKSTATQGTTQPAGR